MTFGEPPSSPTYWAMDFDGHTHYVSAEPEFDIEKSKVTTEELKAKMECLKTTLFILMALNYGRR